MPSKPSRSQRRSSAAKKPQASLPTALQGPQTYITRGRIGTTDVPGFVPADVDALARAATGVNASGNLSFEQFMQLSEAERDALAAGDQALQQADLAAGAEVAERMETLSRELFDQAHAEIYAAAASNSGGMTPAGHLVRYEDDQWIFEHAGVRLEADTMEEIDEALADFQPDMPRPVTVISETTPISDDYFARVREAADKHAIPFTPTEQQAAAYNNPRLHLVSLPEGPDFLRDATPTWSGKAAEDLLRLYTAAGYNREFSISLAGLEQGMDIADLLVDIAGRLETISLQLVQLLGQQRQN